MSKTRKVTEPVGYVSAEENDAAASVSAHAKVLKTLLATMSHEFKPVDVDAFCLDHKVGKATFDALRYMDGLDRDITKQDDWFKAGPALKTITPLALRAKLLEMYAPDEQQPAPVVAEATQKHCDGLGDDDLNESIGFLDNDDDLTDEPTGPLVPPKSLMVTIGRDRFALRMEVEDENDWDLLFAILHDLK